MKKSKRKRRENLILAFCAVVFIISMIVILLTLFKGVSHRNSVGSLLYSDKDVDFNCSMLEEDDLKLVDWKLDGLFNENGAGAKTYAKIVYTYKNENPISDETFCSYIDDLQGSKATITADGKCAYNGVKKADVGTSTLGWDTLIERKENIVIITYHNVYQAFKKSTRKEQLELIDSYQKAGFTCR